jgi:hypothetical protein
MARNVMEKRGMDFSSLVVLSNEEKRETGGNNIVIIHKIK